MSELPEFHIKRDENGKNYVVFQKTQFWYEERMLSETHLSGILPLAEGSRSEWKYELQGQKSLLLAFERVPMNLSQITQILHQILRTIEDGREFLLREECFLLQPEFIFMSFPDYRIFLCYYPGVQKPFPEQMGKLLEMFLNRVDYREEKAISIVYELYMLLQEPDMSISRIRERLQELSPYGVQPSVTNTEMKEIVRKEKSTEIGETAEPMPQPSVPETTQKKEKRFSLFGVLSKKTQLTGKVSTETILPSPYLAEPKAGFYTQRTRVLKVNPVKSEPVLISVKSGEETTVDKFPFFIGSLPEYSNFVLTSDTVSRFHAKFQKKEGKIYITDLNSTNGTRLNGRLLEAGEEVCLEDGDRICFAEEEFCLQLNH